MIGNENGRNRYTGSQAHGRSAGQPDRTDARTESPATGKDSIENAGIRAGEIIAYRAWRLIQDGPNKGKLLSMVVPYIWHPKKIGKAGGPRIDCDVGRLGGLMTWFIGYYNEDDFRFSPDGFFAFKEKSKALCEYNYSSDFYGSYVPTVFGRVALWGQVIEFEQGYRGEFAKVVDIDYVQTVNGADDALASDLNQLYAA